MATEQQLLDALEQSIADTDRSNSDLLLVMKEGNLSDVILRDNTVVPSLSKRVKENTDVFKGEFEASVNLQTQAQLDLFNTNATTVLNTFDTNATEALDSFDGTSTQALTDLQTAIDSINNEGNAASATRLQTPRKINGVDFDGTADISIPSMPMGVPIFHGGLRSTIETGYVACDGQLLNRDDYPAMWAKVQATFPLITDADWLDNPSNRGSYSSGDGATTFRMPDYNGVQTDSLKGLFLRGDGGGTIGGVAVSSGTTVLSDAIRNITGSLWNGDNWNLANAVGAGAFRHDNRGASAYSPREIVGVDGGWIFDASKVVPTASENRPVSAVGVWICRVGSTLTEVANPTLHAVLTGGNTFSGTQKMEAVEFNDSTVIRGLVDDLTTGGIDKALTAEMGKLLLAMFANSLGGTGRINLPNPTDIDNPIVIQWGAVLIPGNSNQATASYNITFPNNFLGGVCNMSNNTTPIVFIDASFSKTGVTVRTNTNTAAGVQSARYIAIGY